MTKCCVKNEKADNPHRILIQLTSTQPPIVRLNPNFFLKLSLHANIFNTLQLSTSKYVHTLIIFAEPETLTLVEFLNSLITVLARSDAPFFKYFVLLTL